MIINILITFPLKKHINNMYYSYYDCFKREEMRESNTIPTHYFTIFLQTVKVANFYWFSGSITNIIKILFTNNHIVRLD